MISSSARADAAPRGEAVDTARQLGLLWGGVALAILLVAPFGSSLASQLPACPLKAAIDLPCPACGSTRSAQALSRFDLLAALRVSPLATLAWIGFLGGGLLAGVAALARRPLREPSWQWPLAARLALVGAVLANWLYLVWAGT